MKTITYGICTILVACSLLHGDLHFCNAVPTRTKFKAAVYEHAVILPSDRQKVVSREEALHVMRQNLAVFSEQAAEAKRQNVDILVFPEDGIYGMGFNRQSQAPYLEFIPDPEVDSWIPCDDPSRYANTEVQYELSCMAKRNQLYIVANIGDRQPCNASTHGCPDDLHYQFNTDVAYDPRGQLVARYHKRHLFFEYQFDTPPAKVVSFDTPFGRWGMFTCFDILFYDPAVASVQRENISNIAFPTAWMDALPLLASVQFHSAFARRFGVNFLAANVHWPIHRFHGSGIYSRYGQAAFYHNATLSSEARLIVAELDVLEMPSPETHDGTTSATETNPASFPSAQTTQTVYGNETNLNLDRSDDGNIVPTFTSILFHDLYTFALLVRPNDTLRVCNNTLCCQLTYALTPDPNNQDLFAFGAFDGDHTVEGDYYLQICALVRCANQSQDSCGSPTNESATMFHALSISGSFETEYVYPEVLLSTETNHLRLSRADEWSFTGIKIESRHGFSYPLLAAALFGRDYSRDKSTNTDDYEEDAVASGLPARLQVEIVSLYSALAAAVVSRAFQ